MKPTIDSRRSSHSNSPRVWTGADVLISNMRGMRFNLMELSGATGDLGTFIPLSVAMSFVTGMDLGVILIFAGIANVATGFLFGLPVPVQPMKAIAAVAIAEQLLPSEIATAGLIAGAVLFFLGTTGWIERLEQVIPLPVIRGIQLGVGLKLILKAVAFVNDVPLTGPDSMTVAVVLGALLLFVRKRKHWPMALVYFVLGLAVMFWISPSLLEDLHPGVPRISIVNMPLASWENGLLYGALPQIPLTLLNSVFAVCLLSGDLFPGRCIRTRRMAVSVGLMNLLTCPFGAMPMCHGSGGLAGQYHFGARTGGSVVALGMAKVAVGVLLGASAIHLIQQYPQSILAVLLFFAGVELALPARDQSSRKTFTVTLVTAAGILAVNTLAGFLLGVVVAVILGRSNDSPEAAK